jgi:hypothetical protein
MYAAGYPFTLDTECEIFQIMGKRSVKHVDWLNTFGPPKAYNTLAHSFPMFLHFGGRAPGMREWYERLYGGSNG